MNRKSIAALGVVVAASAFSFSSVGCNNAADKEKQADKAQIEADQKRAEAEQKAQAAKADDLSSADKAQQKANDLRNEATQELDKERADYKDKITQQIADLDAKIADLRWSVDHGATTKRAEYERYMTRVQTDRARLVDDLRAVSATADATAWTDLKKKIDTDLDTFKKTVRTASSKIKTVPRTVKTEPVPNDKRVNTPNVYQGPPMPNPATPAIPPPMRGTTPPPKSTPSND